MSTASQNNNDNQEIDLSQVSKKIGLFFESIFNIIFQGILFIKRNLLIVGVLFVLGVVLGFYLDKTTKSYDSQIIVSPNFGSTDYLYAKVELLNSKINENDTVFLKETVGIEEPNKLAKISIEPITDVYRFINNSEKNFEFLKLLSEDGDIKKIVNDNLTSKNYPYHTVNFSTLKKTNNEKTVQPLLDYFNNSDYYKLIQKEYLNNVQKKIISNDSIIKQIDGVLNSFSGAVNGSQRNDKLIYYNENTQLNDIIKTKEELVKEQGNQRIELVNIDKIIKDKSAIINIENKESLNGKMKLFLPFLFLGFFLALVGIKAFYKRQLAKSKE